MTDTRQDNSPRNADDHGIIAGQIVDRSKVANDVLGPVVLASLMSSGSVCSRSRVKPDQQSAESVAKQRETSVDELLSDPMMSALWQAYAITESDVRHLLSDITDRLRAQGELHRRAEALVMRCA